MQTETEDIPSLFASTVDDGWFRPTGSVAIAHDYLATMGGAERVLGSMCRAFPGAPVFTSMYEPELVNAELADDLDVRTTPLNRVSLFRHNHRAAMPLLASAFSRFTADADVVLCSSSGWAHGIQTEGRKVVYCHNPARWLYQRDEYLRGGRRMWAVAASVMQPFLLRWDRRAASSCDRYLANSSIVASRIRNAYGIEAEVIPPPATLGRFGDRRPIEGIEPGIVLCVARLIAHKNVDVILEAFGEMPDLQLVVAGDGPERAQLEARAPANVRFVGRVDDDELRWLYVMSRGLVAAGREDFGLVPVEGALFGKPSALLRYGGFLDTMIEDETAMFFDEPTPCAVRLAVRRMVRNRWDAEHIRANASRFSEAGFIERLRAVVADELSLV